MGPMQMPPGMNGEALKSLGLGSLLGNAQSQSAPSNASAQDEQRAIMEQFQQLHGLLNQIATQFPSFQPIADQCVQASSQGMMDIVNQLASAGQSPAPKILG